MDVRDSESIRYILKTSGIPSLSVIPRMSGIPGSSGIPRISGILKLLKLKNF